MNITTEDLRQIIQEELDAFLCEDGVIEEEELDEKKKNLVNPPKEKDLPNELMVNAARMVKQGKQRGAEIASDLEQRRAMLIALDH